MGGHSWWLGEYRLILSGMYIDNQGCYGYMGRELKIWEVVGTVRNYMLEIICYNLICYNLICYNLMCYNLILVY